MTSKHRSPSILINEAKLLASAPETVAAWLEKSGEVSFWSKDADAELELNLLARNERLIDLSLAEHGLSTEVLHQLFHRNDEVIRAAVLSNQRVLKLKATSGYWVEHWQFVNVGPDVSWMAALTLVEAEALFSNRSLPDTFIADFFEQKDVWETLTGDQRLSAANCIIGTLKDRRAGPDRLDRLEVRRHWAVYDASWRFSSRAPVDDFWAYALSELYSYLELQANSNFDPLEVAERWRVPKTDTSELEGEERDNEYGYLSTYQRVRHGLARLASRRRGNARIILNNNDVAIRCGGYSTLRLSAQEIKSAFTLDGKLACHHLIENEHVWKNEKLRSAVEDICRTASKDDDYIVSPTSDFNREEIRLREVHPEWFGYKDASFRVLPDKPLSESSIREMANGVATSRGFISLRNLIDDHAKGAWWRFSIIISVLAVIASQL